MQKHSPIQLTDRASVIAGLLVAAGAVWLASSGCIASAPEATWVGPRPSSELAEGALPLDEFLPGTWRYFEAATPEGVPGSIAGQSLRFERNERLSLTAGFRKRNKPAGDELHESAERDTRDPARVGAVRERQTDIGGTRYHTGGWWKVRDVTSVALGLNGRIFLRIGASIHRDRERGDLVLVLNEDPLFPALGVTTWRRRDPSE